MRRAPKGAGSVYHRRDGRWVAVLPLAGGRKKALYGKTQAQVRDKLIKAQRDLQLGQEPLDESLTTGAYITRWIENTCRPKLRPSTFRAYSDIVELHVLPAVGRIPLHKLTRDHVQGVLRQATEAGKAPRTVRNVRAVLRACLNQAIVDGLLSRNVAAMAAVPRLPRTEGKMLSPEDARKLLKAAQGSRWAAFYEVMLTLGLRRGEALGLRWVDIDFKAATLTVKQSLVQVGGKVYLGEPKTERSRRVLPLPAFLAESLQAHRRQQLRERLVAGARWHDTGLVFVAHEGQAVFPRNLLRDFQEVLKSAGLPHMRLHDLRHSAASLLLAQGVPPKQIQEILGHSSIGITMDLYSHVMPTMLRASVDKMVGVLHEQAHHN